MGRYKKRPEYVIAFRLEPVADCLAIGAMFLDLPIQRDVTGHFVTLPIGERSARVSEGDWVVTDAAGRKSVMTNTLFQTNYEEAPLERDKRR